VLGITLDDENIFIVHIDEGLAADVSHLTRAVSTVTSTDEFTGILLLSFLICVISEKMELLLCNHNLLCE